MTSGQTAAHGRCVGLGRGVRLQDRFERENSERRGVSLVLEAQHAP